MDRHLFKSTADIDAELDRFAIRSYALLVDDSPHQLYVAPRPGLELEGVYTFTAAAADREVLGRRVQLLPFRQEAPSCDGWLVATASKAVYALIDHLYASGRAEQVIVPLARAEVAPMYSYVDFFKGETNAVLQLHNVFERAYKIHFPLAVRWLLRDLDGEIVLRSQVILPPNETVAIDARELDLPETFAGYLELFADVRQLNEPVIPFLHCNCDYISANGIATLHQSGMRPWPAGSRFTRGFLPDDPAVGLTVSLVNKTSLEPVNCAFTLRYELDGERRETTKTIAPLGLHEMTLVPVHDLFAEELARGARQVDVVVSPDKLLHRPNNYLHPRTRAWSWTGVEHGAAIAEPVLQPARRRRFEEFGLAPWTCAFPLLPESRRIGTHVIRLQDETVPDDRFLVRAYDDRGTLLLEAVERIEPGTQLDLHEHLAERGLLPAGGGLVTLSPDPAAPSVPTKFTFMGAFGHLDHPYLSTYVVGGQLWNQPVEIERDRSWGHGAIPGAQTEQFGKGYVSDEVDTLLVLHNAGSSPAYDRVARLELDLYGMDGHMQRTYHAIAPNSSLTVSLRELLRDDPAEHGPYFAAWVLCRDAAVYGYHVLHRLADDAVSAEHFYHPRFNVPDPLERVLEPPPRTRVLASHLPAPVRRAARRVVTPH